MVIAGIGQDVLPYVSTTDTQAQQQANALPASQTQSPDALAITQTGTGNNNSVKVTITDAGKNMLNSSQQNAAGGDKDTTTDVADLAQGKSSAPGAQPATSAKNATQVNTPPPAQNGLLSNSAYYSVEKNSTDNTQSVVVKIVDSNGNVVREIPPESLLAQASKLNITPNHLYHAVG
ncbi:MAG: flagellar protein FlaG [Nitrospirae bacterium]|nr:flagellar protein FlaG [Nitrospirota bacterium]